MQIMIRNCRKFSIEWDPSRSIIVPLDDKFHFDFIPMTIVQRLVRGINIYKSSGVVHINSRVLKDALSALYMELKHQSELVFSHKNG